MVIKSQRAGAVMRRQDMGGGSFEVMHPLHLQGIWDESHSFTLAASSILRIIGWEGSDNTVQALTPFTTNLSDVLPERRNRILVKTQD